MKNCRDCDPGYPQTATALQTPGATCIGIGKGLPYLSLHLGLGKKLAPNGACLDTPVSRRHNLRSSGGGGGSAKNVNVQKCRAVFSVSSLAYAGQDEAKIKLLNCLNQCCHRFVNMMS